MRKLFLFLFFVIPSTSFSEEWCDSPCANKYKDYVHLSELVYEKNTDSIGSWVRQGQKNTYYNTEVKICKTNPLGTLLSYDCSNFYMKNIQRRLNVSVYKNQTNNKKAIVFRGTNPTDAQDLLADYEVIVGYKIPKMYSEARKLIHRLIDSVPEYKSAIVTGHSLGGGVAEYVSTSLGMKSYTFNPLALNSPLVTDAINYSQSYGYTFQESSHVNIISNNTRGEIDWASSGLDGLMTIGKKIYIYVNESGWLDMHSIKNLRYAIDYKASEGDDDSGDFSIEVDFSEKSKQLENSGYYAMNNKHKWGNGYIQDFKKYNSSEQAAVMSANSSVAYIIKGDIWRKYVGSDGMSNGAGGATGKLGYPISNEYSSTFWGFSVQKQDFLSGSIIWISSGQYFGFTRAQKYNGTVIADWSIRN